MSEDNIADTSSEQMEEQIDDILNQLKDDNDEAKELKISHGILQDQKWTEFDFPKYFTFETELISDFSTNLLAYLKVEKLPDPVLLASQEYLRLKLVNETYRKRRKVRQQDEVNKAEQRLRKHEQKLRSLTEKKEALLEALNKLVKEKRAEKIKSARQTGSAESSSD